ncbi:MAG: YqgE/AlgH family protein [Acidimicrobiales bacterium]
MEARIVTAPRSTGHDRVVAHDPAEGPDPAGDADGPGAGLAGRLLVASTRLGDPNFEGGVIIVLDHGEEGALGLVLNQPTHVPVSEILEAWQAQADLAAPGVVHRGGPVSPDAVIGLARVARSTDAGTGDKADADADGDAVQDIATGAVQDTEAAPGTADAPAGRGWRPVTAAVGTVDLSVAPDDQPRPLAGARLFSGYSGWAPGQLEAELEDRAWFVLPALEADVFCTDAERLWHDVIRRQGGRLSMLATYPRHPTLN